MIAVVDYGVGNLFSICCSLKAVGAEAKVVSDPKTLKSAGKLLLPGVGAFGDAAALLSKSGMGEAVREEVKKGKPLLGICLGMQLLFDKSLEYGEHAGLGLIPGVIRPVSESVKTGMKIPQIGWNALEITKKDSAIFKYVKSGDHVYFVHSYHAVCDDKYISAVTDYGGTVTASAENGNVFGCQFHPEKSGEVGLSILRAFCEKEG
ncbi:MAG: imidazole glycerol phosphate synthase subunit HisH [Clostridia bacterium]|nr:imidazole glycerol phosphate synthase subunit HisH [Clostridia bacterium]